MARETHKTNIPWMPELPSHWKLMRGKNIFVEKSIKNHPNEPLLAASQKQGVVLKRMLEQKSMEAIGNFESFKLVEKDDFVISLRSFEGGLEIAHYRGIISPVYNVLNFREPDKVEKSYFKHLFKSKMFIQELNVYKKGIRDGQSINYKEFANIIFPIPPLQEQIAIANYLDKQSKKIKHFIQKKQAFIELLKEQRQAVINHKLISEDQKVKIKYCVTKVGAGVTPTGGATVYKNSGVIFLRSQNIHNDGLRLDDVAFITEDIHKSMNGSQVKKDDVLINITGASIGRTFVFELDEEANVNQHVCILRPVKEKILPKFLMLQLQSDMIQNQVKTIEGASREGLTNSILKNYYIYTPPIERQEELITEIKTETAKIDQAISKTEKEIELIKEYREAMIAEAVLGKLHHKIIKPEVCQTTSL